MFSRSLFSLVIDMDLWHMTLIQWLITRVEVGDKAVRHTHVESFLQQTKYHSAQVTKLVCAKSDYLVAWFSASLYFRLLNKYFPRDDWQSIQYWHCHWVQLTTNTRLTQRKRTALREFGRRWMVFFVWKMKYLLSISLAGHWLIKKCEIVTWLCRDIALENKKSLCYGQ